MKLFLIRHLPTPWNVERRLQGSMDISIAPPSEELKALIEENLKSLNGLEWDQILVSEKARTHETARQFGFTQFGVEPLLNELNFGQFEGGPKDKLLEQIGSVWFEDVLQVELGETLLNFQSRLKAFLNAHQSKNLILAFTHGAVIRGLKSIQADGNISRMNRFDIPNASIEILEF